MQPIQPMLYDPDNYLADWKAGSAWADDQTVVTLKDEQETSRNSV